MTQTDRENITLMHAWTQGVDITQAKLLLALAMRPDGKSQILANASMKKQDLIVALRSMADMIEENEKKIIEPNGGKIITMDPSLATPFRS